ncbi:hypothetical protein [Streptomyces sp. DHE17-7]|uniref:hypothetical protein n=1 Tax=Streptomyces sp. DHE17-7 TaxID=2759949 RepID=UPI000EC64116|nr:hypothetical protein [Streptomyces sp. DHE17-7]MBJ6623576.1 hypothetical protein [Streptomyces sp. DHE17-7]RIH58370.1 hypothetical protein D3C59_35605 [Streptomyces sp. SHP22-7]RIH58664.1 hypothetical protein D3C59_33525 [Streptomyces sp. SHP22-7]
MQTRDHKDQVSQELADGAAAVLRLNSTAISPDLGQAVAKLLRSSAVYARAVGDEPSTVKDALALARAVQAADRATEK